MHLNRTYTVWHLNLFHYTKKKDGVFLIVTFIIGLVIFIISFLLSVFFLFGAMFKNIGTTSLGIIPVLFFLLIPSFCLIMELTMYREVPHAWGIAYFFIALNGYFLVLQYILAVGSAIFTKNSIYRLTKFFIWKKYSYDDVIGYTMQKSSGLIRARFGQHKTVTFDMEIYFNDDQYTLFGVNDSSNGKVQNIHKLLNEHHCRRNGRIRNKSKIFKIT